MKILDTLDRQQLLVVTGKGGVGKSTMTAVLGRRLAARGRRVLLIEVDPRESLHHMLEVPPSGGELVKVGPRLWLQHVDPRRLIDDLVRDKLKVAALAKRVISSPIHLHFTEGAPGLKETAVFGRVLRMVEGHVPRGAPVPQVVLLDAPASGHGVAWLTSPQLISEVIKSGPVGQLSAQIADFMNDAERFGVVAVTTAEEMPVQESLELFEELAARLDRRPELLIINGLYPPFPKNRVPSDPAGKLWFDRRRVNERELHRLRTAWNGPTVELPLLPIDPGQPLVGALARRLEESL